MKRYSDQVPVVTQVFYWTFTGEMGHPKLSIYKLTYVPTLEYGSEFWKLLKERKNS